MLRAWLEILENKTKELMDLGYTINSAMAKAWDDSYGGIYDDYNLWDLSITELRRAFWDDSFQDLEVYEESIIDNAGRFLCKECNWFSWDHIFHTGKCSNFNIYRDIDSRCISDEE